MLESKVKDVFTSKFNKTPENILKAPGRINIIGEHTDYNDGYVLPAAINHYVYMALSKNASDTYNIYSIDFDESASLTTSDLHPGESSWLNLISGVIIQLSDKISGFDLVVTGNIPAGAGLSSSAALCCGTAFGISNLFDLSLDKWTIARIAQKSEHTFAKVQCGIMDQFASMFGKAEHVLILDCLNLTFEESKIDISGYKFLLLDSNVKHQLSESDYNARRTESAEALKLLQIIDNKIKTFRDVTLEMLNELLTDEVWWKRAYHIVSENQRVLALSKALTERKISLVGSLLNQGHRSQQNHYEITCAETDYLFDILNKEEIILGARQVGGGFGGCMLCIVEDKDVDSMITKVNSQYKKEFGKITNQIPIEISKGCHLVDEL